MNPGQIFTYSTVPTEYPTIRSSAGGSGIAGGSSEAGGGTIGGSGGSSAHNGVYTPVNGGGDLLYQAVNESSILKPDPYLPILLRIDKMIDKIDHKLDMLLIQFDKRAHYPTDNVLLLNRVIDLTQRMGHMEKRSQGENVAY